MSRPLRIVGPGLTYHIFARGNGRMVIFTDDCDRLKFLELLADVVSEFGLHCHAFCEMNTHYHLVATTTEANLSQAMRDLDGRFAEWWNDRHGHVGHVFQGRFGAPLIQEDFHLLIVCRYVVQNPVRGGLVDSPEQWRWSSYRATAGLDAVPSFLEPHTVWRLLGSTDSETGANRFRAFVSTPGNDARMVRGPVIGDASFIARFDRCRQTASREVPRRERQTRTPLEELFTGAVTREARNARARAAFTSGYSASEIARFLELKRDTVRRMIVGGGDQAD